VRPSIANDPEHWRKRAEDMRTLANEIKDPLSKEMMLRIVDDYERLAKRARDRATLLPQSNLPTTGRPAMCLRCHHLHKRLRQRPVGIGEAFPGS
jgi:hypothetical protein